MRDELGVLYLDSDFITLFRADWGQSALSPGLLALVSVMQFAEGLTDRQAAEAVRSRIDWKYALGLEITDSGFDYSVLSEWRSRLIAAGRERQLLDKMLAHFQDRGWLKARGKARTDSTHVIGAIRKMNRLECVGETLRHALNQLATVIDARNRTKRDTNWTGYTVHLTETCDRDLPHLITNVETTPATIGDVEMTQVIHQALADKHLLPQEHIVDTAYVDAQHLLASETQLGIELLGPVPSDSSWQEKAKLGFELSCFTIDWEHRHANCPQGHISQSWHQRSDHYGNPVIQVRFRRPDCAACPVRSQCTHSPAGARVLTLKPQPLYEALAKGRARQHTQEFKQRYALRAGVESSLSQGIRVFGLRGARYMGLAKTRLQHIVTAAAMNLSRMWAFWRNIPIGLTRVSNFSALFTSGSS
ncbi:transposase [Kamptonema animale]|uniref:transposase n=1 Tax=Kamptonema animale TaxID=92934 RepID=UPI003A8FDE99